MANFPNSVTVYTTRNPGDKIPSADWNSFGAEINAIEDGLINGTAPINSSNATFNAVTVSSNLTVSKQFSFVNRVGASVYNTLSQNVNSGAATGLNFDTDLYDNVGTGIGGMHDGIINSSRIMLVSSGLWLVGGSVAWSNSTAGSYRVTAIRVNDANVFPSDARPPMPTISTPYAQGLTVLHYATSTSDYVTLVVQQDSGSTMSISSGQTGARFWATFIGV